MKLQVVVPVKGLNVEHQFLSRSDWPFFQARGAAEFCLPVSGFWFPSTDIWPLPAGDSQNQRFDEFQQLIQILTGPHLIAAVLVSPHLAITGIPEARCLGI